MVRDYKVVIKLFNLSTECEHLFEFILMTKFDSLTQRRRHCRHFAAHLYQNY